MTADSQFSLQQAVFNVLSADGGLASFLSDGSSPTKNRVYDAQSPDDPTYPFLVIGGTTALEWDTKTEDGMDVDIMIHSFSRYRGNKQVRQVMGAVVDALDRKALTVVGHDLVFLRFEFSEVIDDSIRADPEGLARHGVQRFRALTEAA